MKRKLTALALGLLMAVTPVAAKPQYDYIERKTSESIAQGITHDTILSFTSDGIRGIHVLSFQLNSPAVGIIPLYNRATTSAAAPVTRMVDQRNAVAGVNADFFNYKPMFPLGLAIENGEMIYSNSAPENPTPSFLLANDGSMTIGRVEISMELVLGERVIPIGTMNKPNGYGSTGAYTRRWGAKSRGGKVNKQTEVAVANGQITARVDGGEPLDIPEGGYVINIKDGMYLPSVGEPAEVRISGISIGDTRFGIGAGSVILKDGAITNSHINIAGRHPRTAFGVNKATGQAVLVTVDGRSEYHGMDASEVAELLQKLGMTDGFNLDGGGSTTMAIRDVNTGKAAVVNAISEQRSVATGIGLVSNSTPGEAVRMEVVTEGDKLFKNTTKWVNVKLYDANGNRVKSDLSQVRLTGNLAMDTNGHSFTPRQAGSLTLTVQYGLLRETVPLQVLETPSVLLLQNDTLSLGNGESYRIPDVEGIDAVGNRALIRAGELGVSVIGNVGKVQNGVFTRNASKENGALALSFGEAKNRMIISKSARKVSVNPLGTPKGLTASSTPAGTRAALSSIEDKRPLLRLWYNFEKATTAKQATLNFTTPTTLPDDTVELSVFVKNLGDLTLGATVVSAGKEVKVDFTKNLELGGYAEYRGKLPGENGIVLKNLFVSEIEGQKTKGYVDLKDVAAVVSPDTSRMFPEARTLFYDHLKTDALASTDLAVLVYGEKTSAKSLPAAYAAHRFVSTVGAAPAGGNVQSQRLQTLDNVLFVKLKNTQGGLRATDPAQWNELLTTVSNSPANTVILTMEGGSKDELGIINSIERRLFKETLESLSKSGKRVLVVTNLKEPTTTRFEEGVRYINLNPAAGEILSLNINRIGDNLLYALGKVAK